jgi:hypothetical protein
VSYCDTQHHRTLREFALSPSAKWLNFAARKEIDGSAGGSRLFHFHRIVVAESTSDLSYAVARAAPGGDSGQKWVCLI